MISFNFPFILLKLSRSGPVKVPAFLLNTTCHERIAGITNNKAAPNRILREKITT